MTPADIDRLRNERDLAVAALRLYRDALRTAGNAIYAMLAFNPEFALPPITLHRITAACAAADAILGTMPGS